MAKLERLTTAAADAAIAALADWTRQDEKWIARSYRFVSFPAAIAFVDQIAEVAEELDHHPLIGIDYKKVTLRLTTWHAGGLTELDMRSAQRYNEIYQASIAVNR